MTREEMRFTLLDSTVKTIEQLGLDKATTRNISRRANLNEAYIYRIFNDKEDLFKETFAQLDREMVTFLQNELESVAEEETDLEAKYRPLFFAFWKYLLDNKGKCLCFIRYYFSPYFKKYSLEDHRELLVRPAGMISHDLRAGTDVGMLLDHILTTMLNFASMVINGTLAESDDTAENVFTVAFSSVKPYLKHYSKEAYA